MQSFHMLVMNNKYCIGGVYQLFSFSPHYSLLCVHTRQHMATVAVHVPQKSLWGFRNSGYLFPFENSTKLYFSHNSEEIFSTGPLKTDEDMLPLIKNTQTNSVYIKSTPASGFSPKVDHDWVFPRACKDSKCDVNCIPAKDFLAFVQFLKKFPWDMTGIRYEGSIQHRANLLHSSSTMLPVNQTQ